MSNSVLIETPCAVAFFQGTDALISALSILKTGTEPIQIQFHKGGIIIEARSGNSVSKIQCDKGDLHHYVFNMHPKTHSDVYCYCVVVKCQSLQSILKGDKKACIQLGVYMHNIGNTAVLVASQEGQNSREEMEGVLSYSPFEEYDDTFNDLYENLDPSSIMSDSSLKTIFCKFKGKDFQQISFIYNHEKLMTVKSDHKRQIFRLPFPGNLLSTEEIDDRYDETYRLDLIQENIEQILCFCKLGTNNTIKVYCSYDNPMIFRAKISNYGDFELIIHNDKE